MRERGEDAVRFCVGHPTGKHSQHGGEGRPPVGGYPNRRSVAIHVCRPSCSGALFESAEGPSEMSGALQAFLLWLATGVGWSLLVEVTAWSSTGSLWRQVRMVTERHIVRGLQAPGVTYRRNISRPM